MCSHCVVLGWSVIFSHLSFASISVWNSVWELSLECRSLFNISNFNHRFDSYRISWNWIFDQKHSAFGWNHFYRFTTTILWIIHFCVSRTLSFHSWIFKQIIFNVDVKMFPSKNCNLWPKIFNDTKLKRAMFSRSLRTMHEP